MDFKRIIGLVSLVLVFTIACAQTSEKPATEKEAAGGEISNLNEPRTEEWSDEQKEVWSLFEAGWENAQNQDAEAMVANIHDNAIIWMSVNPTPHRVELLKTVYERWFSYEKVSSSELQPLRIEIFDNIAIVAYYASWKSDKRTAKTKGIMILMKQGDKWLRIGSLTSNCGEPPACMK